jgi:methyl-accepting chemotaxis protein
MKTLTLGQKLWGIVALLWLGIMGIMVVNAWLNRQAMIHERENALAQHVDMAIGLIHSYKAKVDDKTLSLEEAQRAAMDQLRPMRYSGGSGYLGIYRMRDSVVLMLPPSPKQEGAVTGTKDVNGLDISQAIISSAAPDAPSHVSSYWYPKPGQTEPMQKLTYSLAVPEWGWAVFTGAYVDDIDQIFYSLLWKILAMTVVVGLLVTAGILLVMRSIRNSLGGDPVYAADIAGRIADGDLTVSVKTRADDRKSLLYAMRRMQEGLMHTVSAVRRGVEEINVGAREISAGNTDLSSRTEEQAASLEETAASMEQLASTVKQNADNARQANQLAASASEVAERGGAAVSEVVHTMREISGSSSKISEIVSVIDGIAFQTNILALNAAVEAARAGEQGKGFAVVAGEVRTLAQRSASAAKEIKSLIEDSASKVSMGEAQVDRAGRTMQEIVQSVKRVTDIMGEIAAASEEQARGIDQVNQAVSQMDEVTQQNAALVEQSAAASGAMQDQAQGLMRAVGVFKLNAAAQVIDMPEQTHLRLQSE